MATIQIPIPTLKEWKKLKGYGDGAEVSERTGGSVTKDVFFKAFKFGKCPADAFEAISKYYEEKRALLNVPKKQKREKQKVT